MEILSFAALVLLSMFGYSMGAVAAGGKSWPLKPRPADLLAVLLIWTAAIASRLTLGWDRWLLILGWLALAFLAGRLSALFRKPASVQSPMPSVEGPRPRNRFQSLWLKWKGLSGRAGSFQSRLVLSYFFFLLVAPLGLAVKIFGDPLRIKQGEKVSYWLSRPEAAGGLERSRKQS